MKPALLTFLILLLALAGIAWIGGSALRNPVAAPATNARTGPAGALEVLSDPDSRAARSRQTGSDPDGAAPPADGCNLTVETRVRRAPQGGVAVHELLSEGGVRFLGTTGSDGRMVLTRASAVDLALFAWANGTGRSIRIAQPCSDSKVTLDLDPEAELSGRCQDEKGHAVAGVRLLAVPLGLPRPYGDGLDRGDWMGNNPALLRAESGADGAFSFHGADPGQRYAIHAGNASRVLVGQRPEVTAPKLGLVITVAYCYARRLVFHDDRGEPVPVGPDTGTSIASWAGQDPLDGRAIARPALLRDVDRRLAELPDQAPSLPHEVLLSFTSPRSDPLLGPFFLELEVPGHEASQLQFECAPCGTEVSPVDVRLRSLGPRDASVLVQFTDDAVARELGRWPRGRLTLTPAAGGRMLEFPILGDRGSTLVTGIPSGLYGLRFAAASGTFAHPAPGRPAQVFDLRSEPTPFLVPIPNSAVVTFQPVRADGDPYRGPLEVLVSAPSDDAAQQGRGGLTGLDSWKFSGEPYERLLPAAGRIAVISAWPRWSREVHPIEPEILEVMAGATLHHTIVVQ